MDTITSYLPALQSILPSFSGPIVSPLPDISGHAPSSLGPITFPTGNPVLVAFVRHCGCPFAEKEIHLLATETKKNSTIHVVIVQHSELSVTQDWFDSLSGPSLFPSSDRYTLVADPERELYARWGIGLLGWGGMVNADVMKALNEQKTKEGIDMRPTGKGSYRWQNSGGFAVDRDGRVRWRKVAKDSSDVCDYKEAARTIV